MLSVQDYIQQGDDYFYGNEEKNIEQNYEKAFACYKNAADNNKDSYAQYHVAICYFAGLGVETDSILAIKYLKLIDENPTKVNLSKDLLSLSYLNYFLVKANQTEVQAKVIFWHKKIIADILNKPDDQIGIGFCYALGNGIEINKTTAIKYFQLAANNGSKRAFVILRNLVIFDKNIQSEAIRENYQIEAMDWQIYKNIPIPTNDIIDIGNDVTPISYLPSEIWGNVLCFIDFPKDAQQIMWVCKLFFRLVKEYDWWHYVKNHYDMFENFQRVAKEKIEQSKKETIIEIQQGQEVENILLRFNTFLHGLFTTSSLTEQQRNDTIEKLTAVFTAFKLFNIEDHQFLETIVEIPYAYFSRGYGDPNEFINHYNIVISNHHHDTAIEYLMINFLEILRRVCEFYEPSSLLKFYSLPELITKKNQLALAIAKNEYVASSNLSKRGELCPEWCCIEFCCPVGAENLNECFTEGFFFQNTLQIIANTAFTFSYYTGAFKAIYNSHYNEMKSVHCADWVNWGDNGMSQCRSLEKNYHLFGNCTDAFSVIQSSKKSCWINYKLPDWEGEDGLLTDYPSSFVFASLGSGFLLATSLHFYHKIPWHSKEFNKYLLKIVYLTSSIGFAALNIALPYFAQKSDWSYLPAYYQGCTYGCYDDFVGYTPVTTGYYLPGTDKIPPLVMGFVTTGIVAFVNPQTYHRVKNYFAKQDFRKNLQENSIVAGLLQYGTFSQSKNENLKALEEIVINDGVSDSEELTYQSTSLWSSCNLF